jgi:hypothetical protein
LRELGIWTRDKNTAFEVVIYYGFYSVMWLALFAPGIYDVVLFIIYALNDFASAVEVYVDEHLSGWTIYACA